MRITAIILHETTLLVRNRLQLLAVAAFLLLGLYGIYYGHSEITQENNRRHYLADSMQHAQQAYAAQLQTDTTTAPGRYQYEKAALPSLVRFNYYFLTARQPAALAALSLGMRDMQPAYYLLNAQSLYVQTLKGEIANPFKLSAGNFDLGFVLVYLLPLLVIALCFDVLSQEKESGLLPLLRISGYALQKLVLLKLLFRYGVTTALVIVLSLAGMLVTHTPVIAGPAVWWLGIVSCYNLLWHALLLLVISGNRSSAFNAMAALAAWVLLLIVVPVTLNAVITVKGAPAVTLSTLMRSRNMEESDEAMHQALQTFYHYHPEVQPADSTPSRFVYFQGYSAYLYNTDKEADQLVNSFTQAVQAKAATVNRFLLVNPAANTLLLLNHIAGNDLAANLAFKKEVAAFHQQIFWFANRALFQNRYMTRADYQHTPVFHPAPAIIQGSEVTHGLLLLLLFSTGCVVIGFYRLRKHPLLTSA